MASALTNHSLPSRSLRADLEMPFTMVRTVALHLSPGVSPVMV